jgi:hypothetical protein
VALPILPIKGEDTLCYGSCNSGKTIHSTYDFIAEQLNRATSRLHLACHLLKEFSTLGKVVELSLGGDVEMHNGKDHNFYLIDLARTFPPESPSVYRKFHDSLSPASAIFFRMLRPELLLIIKRQNVLPAISSDALSNWGNMDADYHNEVANLASEFLFRVQIPELAHTLDNLGFVPDSFSLYFHQHGVNMRHIALVAFMCVNTDLRRQLVEEICIRVCKQMLRCELRKFGSTVEYFSQASQVVKRIQQHVSQLLTALETSEQRDTSIVEKRFGSIAVLMLREQVQSIHITKCLKKAVYLCGLTISNDLDVTGSHQIGKVIPFVNFLKASVELGQDFNKVDITTWLNSLETFEDCLKRDWYNKKIRRKFVSTLLRFAKSRFWASAIDANPTKIRSLVGICSLLLDDDSLINDLVKLTSIHRDIFWDVIFGNLPRSLLTMYFFLHSIDNLSESRLEKKEVTLATQKYASRVILEYEAFTSRNVEEFVFFWVYVLNLCKSDRLSTLKSNVALCQTLCTFISRSTFQQLYTLASGLKWDTCESPFSFFFEIFRVLHDIPSLRRYLQTDLHAFHIRDPCEFMSHVLRKEIRLRRPNHFWDFKVQDCVLSLINDQLKKVDTSKKLNGTFKVSKTTEVLDKLTEILDLGDSDLTQDTIETAGTFKSRITGFFQSSMNEIGLDAEQMNSLKSQFGDAFHHLGNNLSLSNLSLSRIDSKASEASDASIESNESGGKNFLSKLFSDMTQHIEMIVSENENAMEIDWFDRFEILDSFFPNEFIVKDPCIIRLVESEQLINAVSFLKSKHGLRISELEIVHLDNANTGIGDTGAIVLANAFKTTNGKIKKLSLSKNHIGDKGFLTLCAAFQSMSSLESVDFSWNNVTDEGLTNLTNCSLKELSLSGNDLSLEGIELVHKLGSNFVCDFMFKRHGSDTKPFYASLEDWNMVSVQEIDQVFYSGQMQNGQPSGVGRVLRTYGESYTGDFKEGTFNGIGTFHSFDGSSYFGDWQDGKRHGRGKAIYSNMDLYDGQFRDDKRHGFGVLNSSEGIYTGQWMLNKKHGKGTYKREDGSVYEGEWKIGKMDGIGTLRYFDGGEYQGEWRLGKRHGCGTYKYPDGDTYEGQWFNGHIEGKGIFVYHKLKAVYNGEWRESKKSGHGTLTSENQGKYEGGWWKDRKHGEGFFYSTDGRKFKQTWNNNCLVESMELL